MCQYARPIPAVLCRPSQKCSKVRNWIPGDRSVISNGQASVIIVEDDASMNQALERIVRRAAIVR